MAEAPHGTAPGARGQGHRQPDGDDPRRGRAPPLRGGARRRGGRAASRAIYEAVLETVAAGIRTPDLGGHAGTTEFTDAVIEASGASSSSGLTAPLRTGSRISPDGGRSADRRGGAAPGARLSDAADAHPARTALVVLGVLVLVMVAAKGLHDVAQTGLNGLSTGVDLRARRRRAHARLRDPQARQLRPRRLPHLRRLHGLPGQRHLGPAAGDRVFFAMVDDRRCSGSSSRRSCGRRCARAAPGCCSCC